jgi:hypothetical protein
MAFCLVTAFMFFAQIMLCAADDAGLVTCQEHTVGCSHHDSTSSDVPAGHDCCDAHSASVFASGHGLIVAYKLITGDVFTTDDRAPEEPVYTIEYPPQLS